MNIKRIHTGYLLGLSLLISSIIYFFASNWQGIERVEKIGLAIGLMLLFFIVATILSRFQHSHRFLERWLWLTGTIAFGVSVALIGQTYNSHADSYLLYLIWLVPALVFGALTGYKAFYVLGFLLSQLAFYFYVFPSSYFPDWEPETALILVFIYLLFTHAWFFLSRSSWLRSNWIMFGSFCFIKYVFIASSFGYWEYSPIMAWLYVGYGLISVFLWKHREEKELFILTGISLGLFLFGKMLEGLGDALGDLLPFFLLVVVGFIVFLTIKYLPRLDRSEKGSETWKRMFKSSLLFVITVVSTVMLISAFSGIMFLTFSWDNALAFMFSSLFLLLLPGLALKEKIPFLSNILLLSGLSILALANLIDAFSNRFQTETVVVMLVSFGMIGVVLKLIANPWIGSYAYLLANGVLLLFLFKMEESLISLDSNEPLLLLVLIVGNGLIHILGRDGWFNRNALVYSIVPLFILTFFFEGQWLYWLLNSVFLLLSTLLVFYKPWQSNPFRYWIGLVLWYAFLFYKYYDIAWSLVHKSITLLVAGLLVLVITRTVSRKYTQTTDEEPTFVASRWKLIWLVVILMISFVTYNGVKNEVALQSGKEIRLALAPVDPRSMLQGDYVTLRYDISTLPGAVLPANKKIKVVLASTSDGSYEYGGYYKIEGDWNKPYEPSDDDIIVNGTTYSDHDVQYGIESYFISEGAGEVVEDKTMALIKVSENGNALLKELE
ncbi:GDYXXLXY domain-containing protein [Alkalihalobacillus hwajinpoensis]|uniref:GDYXXLXY domain-containing protein n=1 Tax=Guptibacillus hwajinpoensis TaxID=208199 RepID=UPI001883BF0A|nr:GDYXXLXY domain-containing protein [Pseudalkalibacillus hwajinpoensis]MBF0706054.1 GDYXXLXY domain-containing protein [Pseudalkalibacillus hwajinpoensis]